MLDDGDDPYVWLEDLDGADAAGWVRDRNAESIAGLTGGERFAALRTDIRQVLDAEDRIPYPGWRGDHLYYGFWRDATHPRGLWRRTTLDQYRRPEPEWDVLLDLDALAVEEGENWVWQQATVLRPGYQRCLISLSRGGADAVVVREFDLVRRAFVEDGFTLPEAKTGVCWIDVDHIYVATDFGPGSLTSSGYPRVPNGGGEARRCPRPTSFTRGARTMSPSTPGTTRRPASSATSWVAASISTAPRTTC
ncbi:hypothetical protein ABZU53_05910 [Micromonospora sp. NPDC005194]|uniref:hypothetical protein n=1 Tax=Micromonospora sp. NPDC005194 TaxID=3156870 RepID=UPI00339F297D